MLIIESMKKNNEKITFYQVINEEFIKFEQEKSIFLKKMSGS